jgi:hypothetical protein
MELILEWHNRPFRNRNEQINLYRRGDVINYKPDGWGWARVERQNPSWRILRVDLTEIECEALVSPELDLLGTKTLLRKRIRRLRPRQVTLTPRLMAYLQDDTRAQFRLIVGDAGERALIRAMEYVKPDADTGQE